MNKVYFEFNEEDSTLNPIRFVISDNEFTEDLSFLLFTGHEGEEITFYVDDVEESVAILTEVGIDEDDGMDYIVYVN